MSVEPPVERPSPEGLLACQHAERCPGCPAIGLAKDEQLSRKASRARDALVRFDETREVPVAEVVSVEPRAGYRTRTKWVADGQGRIGLYARGTHEVVDLAGCPVLRPSVARVTSAILRVREGLAALSPQALRGVDARETIGGAQGVLLALTYARDEVPEEGALEAAARALEAALAADGGPPLALSLSVAERDCSPRVLGTYRIDPSRARLDRIGAGPLFQAAHGSFVQAHRGVAAAIHDRVAAEVARLGPGSRVVELFAGSGALALRLAAEGAHVTAVERFTPAIELARSSAERAGLADRFRGVVADASEILTEGALGTFDAVVVNPPRRGIPGSLRNAIALSRARLVVYVACDPETLARDLAALARAGLALRSVTPFDMMPQTLEVESLAVLERGPLPLPTVLARGQTWVAVDKAPHEPTTPHPEHASSLLERVRLLEGLSRATPVHRLDAGTSGVCLFATSPEEVAPLQRALGAGEKTYIAMVRGIPREKGTIRRSLREAGRNLEATTRYRRRQIVAGHGLVEVKPQEGRMHQIRRHLESLGHPVAGDLRYGHGPTNRHFEETATLDRPFLHCASIALELDGSAVRLESPLAPDLALVLDRLGGQPDSRRPGSRDPGSRNPGPRNPGPTKDGPSDGGP